MKKVVAGALSVGSLFLAAAPAEAAAKSCKPVLNLFAGTNLAGSDVYRIRAEGVSCKTARRVARKGTVKAVAATPNANGRVVVRYRRWRVVDDLTGAIDRFGARTEGSKRIRWLFGEI